MGEGAAGSGGKKSSAAGPAPGGTGWEGAWDVCEGGGRAAGEEGTREAACEGGEGGEEGGAGGGAGVGIAACRSPASLRPAADASVSPSGRRGRTSSSPERHASASLSAFEPLRVASVRHRMTSQKKQATREGRKRRAERAMGLRGSVGPTQRRKAAGMPKPQKKA